MKQLALALLLAVAVNGQRDLRPGSETSNQIRFDVLYDWQERIDAGYNVRRATIHTRGNFEVRVATFPQWDHHGNSLHPAAGTPYLNIRDDAGRFPDIAALEPLRDFIQQNLIDGVRARATETDGTFGWPPPGRRAETINGPHNGRRIEIGNGPGQIPRDVVLAAFPESFPDPPARGFPTAADLRRVRDGREITLQMHATIPPIGGQRVVDPGTRPPAPTHNNLNSVSHITLNLVI